MTLSIGTRLGPYEITGPLGSGGMGEVYRARDTQLDRDVAIKILPELFAADPERVARFTREAKTLAALNHPHIAQIYGFEKAGSVSALVMELVEGPTLADLIAERAGQAPATRASSASSSSAARAIGRGARRGLETDEALAIARQIAEALEAAHELGIIHRDLKPANIIVQGAWGPTPTRRKTAASSVDFPPRVSDEIVVKVLDFGLAKALDPAASGVDAAALTNSPTITSPAAMTHLGVILGTAAYMAPEQAKGRAVDKRADIWAFGCVLYEMLTGHRAFPGEDVSDTLASVLKTDPDWATLPADTPAAIRRLLRRCLEKDRKRRLSDIADARLEVDDALAAPSVDASGLSSARVAVQTAGWRRALPWVMAVGALGVAGAVLLLWAPWRSAPPTAPVRLSAEIGADASLVTDQGAAAVLSPDGTLLVFVAQRTGGSDAQLFVRRLDQLQATVPAGTEGARNPFFSPDGQWVAFFAGGRLKKIAVTGGAAITLCDAPDGRGGSWAEDGTIAFSAAGTPGVSLLQVSSAGGKPEPLTPLAKGEVSQRWPQILPGGKAVLYTTSGIYNLWQDADLVVQTLPTGPRKIVQRGGYYGRYVPSGHLVYMHAGTLFAAPFDLNRLEVAGPSVPVLESVTDNPTATGGAQFAVTGNGTLVYLPAQSANTAVPIVWMNREGKTSALRTTPANWANPRFAPDGGRLAMYINDGTQSDVWVYDWARDTLSRFTFDPAANNVLPVWTPDGRRITFASARADKATLNLYWQRADGTGEVQRLTESKNPQYPTSWHPSGRFLAFYETSHQTATDVMILPMEGDETSGWKPGKPTAFLNSPFSELWPVFSPDGRWLAYASNESGRFEVYVRPFPGPGGKWQVSTTGGWLPVWSPTRHELFYEPLDPEYRIMVAAYTIEGDSFRAEKPGVWADRPFGVRPLGWDFDVHPDGDRVAVAPAPEAQPAAKQDKVVFIFNFFDELRRLAPTAGK